MAILGILFGFIGIVGVYTVDGLSFENCLKNLIRYQALSEGEIAIDIQKEFEDCMNKISEYKFIFIYLIAISVVYTGFATLLGLIIKKNSID
jgi:hypothetical protein